MPARLPSTICAAGLLGCAIRTPPGETARAPAPARRFDAIAISDTRAVTALERAAGFVYAGTDAGLIVWDLDSRQARVIGREQGFPGGAVRALAADGEGALWIAHDAGLARYAAGRFEAIAAPIEAREARLLVVPGGGRQVWIGTVRGVVVVDRTGAEKPALRLPGASITAIADAGRGEGWIATRNEGVHRFDGHRWESQLAKKGLRLREVRSLVRAPEGVLAVGSEAGAPRGALLSGGRWWHYRLRGARALRALGVEGKQERERRAVLEADGVLYFLRRAGADAPRGRVGFDALDEDAPALALVPRGGAVPFEATVAYVDREDGPLFGTERVGVIRADGTTLRTGDVVGGVERLHVGCTAARCYFVGAGERAFAFDGKTVRPVVVDPAAAARARVLAFARDGKGNVFALHGERGQPVVRISREGGGQFVPVGAAEVRVPRGDPHITFATFAPWGNELWVGLHYADADGEDRPHGVAAIDLDAGSVQYHGVREKGQPVQGLAVPNDVRRVVFAGGEIWMAGMSGACRVARKTEVRCYSENDGLEGDIAMDIDEAGPGEMWVASPAGVGRFDGRRWRFEYSEEPGARARTLRRVAAGVMVVGTGHGLVRHEGTTRTAIGAAQGLLGGAVLDIAVDPQQRAWVLTEEGLTILSGLAKSK